MLVQSRIMSAALVILTFSTSSFAQVTINWSTMDSGGAMDTSGGSYDLSGTIGQPDAQVAPVMSGGSFEVTGGFWPVTQVCSCPGDMNLDGKRNGDDIAQFISCIISGGSCSCADLDNTNGVTIEDVSVFVNNLLTSPSCL